MNPVLRLLGSAVPKLCMLGLITIISACGGGGGGGGSTPDAGAGLRVGNVLATGTTQRLYASTVPVGEVTITADVTGDLAQLGGQTVYVVVADPNNLFESNPTVIIVGTGIGNSIRLRGKSVLGRVGSYRGPLTVSVCLDSACTRPFDGSPFQVPLQIDVLPGLQITAASPLVIDLAFGQTPEAVTLPVTVPTDVDSWRLEVTPLQSKVEGAFAYDRLPLPAQGIRLLPRQLPVGSYTQTLSLDAFARVNGVTFPLQATLPVVINVRAAAGVEAAMNPSQVALQALSSGSALPEGLAWVNVLAANGQLYSEVSRVVYLPAGAGNLDAFGIRWLQMYVGVDHRDWDSYFGPFTNACEMPAVGSNIRCLAPGRYAAHVYFRTPAGAELATPLPVTVTVR